MRWIVPLLLSGSCSLLLDAGPKAEIDGGSPEQDAALDAEAIDAAVNTTDFQKPYTCDDNTQALYHFDSLERPGLEGCDVDARELFGGPDLVIHSGFSQAAQVLSEPEALASAPYDDLTYDALTVEAWVRVRSETPQSANLAIVNAVGAENETGTRRFRFSLVREATMYVLRLEIFGSNCQTNISAQTGGVLSDDEWKHVAVTATTDGTTVTITFYVDGVEVNTQTMPQVGLCTAASGTILVIGGETPNGAGPLTGTFNHVLDEVRISDVVRTFEAGRQR